MPKQNLKVIVDFIYTFRIIILIESIEGHHSITFETIYIKKLSFFSATEAKICIEMNKIGPFGD